MTFALLYHASVVKDDIPKLSPAHKGRIRDAIEDKLSHAPEIFGKPLRRSLKGYRALRVGDYRIIFHIENDSIKILLIAHRSLAYQKIKKRTNKL